MNLQHYRKADGQPKIGYDTEDEAQRQVNIEAGENAYQCSLCRRWHVGHRPGSTFRSRRDARRKRHRKDVY